MLNRGGTISDDYPIDKKSFLFDIYRDVIALQDYGRLTGSIILVSQMRHVKAARITFDREYCFKWNGWKLSERSPYVEATRVNIENKAWSR